jgi:RimJ/RimL family protein N-acetyltransferase
MLCGKRVILRAIEPPDLPNYVRWFADPEVLAYFGLYQPQNLAQEQTWYERQNENSSSVNFAIDFEGRHVGGCGFANIDAKNQHAEVGLFIGEKALWDQGLGKDVLATLVNYGFDFLNLHRIYLRVFANNQRAVHAYEQIGFVHEGRFRETKWRHGRWLDFLYMMSYAPNGGPGGRSHGPDAPSAMSGRAPAAIIAGKTRRPRPAWDIAPASGWCGTGKPRPR